MRDINLSNIVIRGELRMVDRIKLKRIGRWRDKDARHKFVKRW